MYRGEKVRLREYRKEDIALAQDYLNDPEVKKGLFPGNPYPLTETDEQKWFEEQSAFKDLYNFAIETLEQGVYVGGCGINNLDWKNRIATIGIFIAKEHWGNGYAKDALRVLIDFIFRQLNVNKVKLHVYSFNQRAISVYRSLGFKEEGVLRQELFRDGAYHDNIIMSILLEEYNNREEGC